MQNYWIFKMKNQLLETNFRLNQLQQVSFGAMPSFWRSDLIGFETKTIEIL